MAPLMTLLECRKVNSSDGPDLVNDMLDVTDRHMAHANAAWFPGLRRALTIDSDAVHDRSPGRGRTSCWQAAR